MSLYYIVYFSYYIVYFPVILYIFMLYCVFPYAALSCPRAI